MSSLTSQHIFEQYNVCRQENQDKLKQVRNLEDLVNFKVTTVSKKLQDMSYEGQTELFDKLCDPLLQNSHYPSITKKAYTSAGSKISKMPDMSF